MNIDEEEAKSEREWRKEQRDAWRQDQADKTAEKQALQDAFRPVAVESVAGGAQGAAMLRDKTMGPPSTPMSEPLDVTSEPVAFRVGSGMFDSEQAARLAAEKANAPDAQMGRAATALRQRGLIERAAALEHSDRQAQLSKMQLADAQWKNELGAAFAGGHEGLARFAAKSTTGPLAGYQVRVVPSDDGKSVTYMAADEKGNERPIGQFPAGREGVIQAGYQFDRLVTPEQRMQHFEQQQQRALAQSNADRSFGLQAASLQHQISNSDREFGLRSAEAGQNAALKGMAIRKGEMELSQALNSNRVPDGVRSQVSGLQKQLEDVNGQLTKAMADPTYNKDAEGIKGLRQMQADLNQQIYKSLSPYVGATSDPLGRRSGGAPSGGVQEFVQQVRPQAEQVAKQLNVPVEAVIGQWGLETGWGKSVIPGTNNLGNIKDFSGGGPKARDNMTGSRDSYRQYASTDEFAGDFTRLLGTGRYSGVRGATDANRYFSALKQGGYAEDPDYVAKGAAASEMVRKVMQGDQKQVAQTPQSKPAASQESAPVALSEGGQVTKAEPPKQQAKAPASKLPEAAERAGVKLDQAREELAALTSKPGPGLAAGAEARQQYADKVKAARVKVAEAEKAYQDELPDWVKRASFSDGRATRVAMK